MIFWPEEGTKHSDGGGQNSYWFSCKLLMEFGVRGKIVRGLWVGYAVKSWCCPFPCLTDLSSMPQVIVQIEAWEPKQRGLPVRRYVEVDVPGVYRYISIMFVSRRPISCHEAWKPKQREIHGMIRYHMTVSQMGTYGVLNCSFAVDFPPSSMRRWWCSGVGAAAVREIHAYRRDGSQDVPNGYM